MIALFVSVPLASFRIPQAREYWETLPCPPPATVYGMLLATVGEPNRLHHEGAEVALAVLSAPELSVVVRTLWRVKDRRLAPGIGENRRPDFQELLSNVRLAIWVRTGAAETARPSLSDRVTAALARPSDVNRFGGLSLGESTHLIDELRALGPADHGESAASRRYGRRSSAPCVAGPRWCRWDAMGTVPPCPDRARCGTRRARLDHSSAAREAIGRAAPRVKPRTERR
jgi:CRISPR-associated protein Cas5t